MSDRDSSDSSENRTLRRFQHEVRTPLGQIIGYAELLEEELEDRGQQDLAPDLQRIRDAARKLLDLVDGRLRSTPEVAEQNVSSDVPPDPDAEDREAASEGPGIAVAEPADTRAARILVVDDDPQNRGLIARRLERQGYQAETADGGTAMLRRIDAEDFDLIMLDVMMPGMNGLEALERIRRERSMAELPVILATALAETPDAVEGLGRGANDYVTKPFDFPLVMARVKTQLAMSREARRAAELSRKLEFRNSFIREALGQDVSADQLVELSETPSALDLAQHRRVLTTLLVDVQGSLKLSESLQPSQYLTVLRNTLGALGEVVSDYQGTVDSFSGDSLIATFGLPEPSDEDTARAAACAIAMQLEIFEVNARNATAQLPSVEIAIGVATGEVVVGGFGSGAEMRFKAIGEPFMQAARIESSAAGGEVWICDTTRERLGELAELSGDRDLEGLRAHRLLGLGGEWLVSLRAGASSGTEAGD